MAAQGRWRRRLIALLGGALAGVALGAGAQDTTFLAGPELAARLRQNLVYIEASDIHADEHGYGLVVGGDAETLWVVTARHVIVETPMLGLATPERPSQRIRLRFCADPSAALVPAAPWPAFDAGGADVALLRVARPSGYQWIERALAVQAAVGEPVWLLGSENDCKPVPAEGHVRAVADAGHDLRIDFPASAVQGGSSGGPVLSGAGIVGLMKATDSPTSTVHSIGDLQRRVQAATGARWALVDARNIPPGDARAARADLAETLDKYLLAVRDVHRLLQLQDIPRPTLTDYVANYNAAIGHFMTARRAHDGTLATFWPPTVLPAWAALRDELWALHLNFWNIDPALMAKIFKSQHTTPEMQARLKAFEPDLVRLETDSARFMGLIAKEH